MSLSSIAIVDRLGASRRCAAARVDDAMVAMLWLAVVDECWWMEGYIMCHLGRAEVRGQGASVRCAGCRGLMRPASAIVSAWMKRPTAVADRPEGLMCGGGAMLAEAPRSQSARV